MAALSSIITVTGPLLVGSWVNSLLYSAELAQVIRYFTAYPDDEWLVKALVLLCWLIDTAAAIGSYAGVYLYTITHVGDMEYLSRQNWTFPFIVFTTGVVAALVQCFLVVRYMRFSRNVLFSLFLFLVIGLALSASFVAGVIVGRYPLYTDRGRLQTPAMLWIISQAVTDILIALALVLEFRKARSNFRNTQSVLNRLAVHTIQTGGATATVATAALVAYLVNKQSNVPLGIAYSMGRVYVLTMLSNLNSRKNIGRGIGAMSEGGATGTQFHAEGASGESGNLGGIHIHRSAVVTIDPENGPRIAMEALNASRHADKTRTENESDAASAESKVQDSVWASRT
ncbi:hypothetical protein MIND_00984000 [Mycena indigotica]|uniref:DUF6534 domain-containing protein n=1 Tax=Mycena indigotica TaxID=2126181 RepID=A0A8H6SEK2_9AGAR|nr:uncharacterized protein MIND_00984000 [Mycena indigotica]KAF7297502.1 hypothetical protein MIND_00984000 [Mycena indigotica]